MPRAATLSFDDFQCHTETHGRPGEDRRMRGRETFAMIKETHEILLSGLGELNVLESDALGRFLGIRITRRSLKVKE